MRVRQSLAPGTNVLSGRAQSSLACNRPRQSQTGRPPRGFERHVQPRSEAKGRHGKAARSLAVKGRGRSCYAVGERTLESYGASEPFEQAIIFASAPDSNAKLVGQATPSFVKAPYDNSPTSQIVENVLRWSTRPYPQKVGVTRRNRVPRSRRISSVSRYLSKIVPCTCSET